MRNMRLTVRQAEDEFTDTLIARSPQTAKNYASALNRFNDFLAASRLDPEKLSTDELRDDVLERFYTWLLRHYGREGRTTAVTYLAETRAFFRYLDRKRLLGPDLSYERIRSGLRELVGRQSYHSPRVDDSLALIVTRLAAECASLPQKLVRNEVYESEARALLRDRAIVQTLFSTGLRRAEAASLNRADIQGGRASSGIVTGKGNKERVVFFDEAALGAIRAYLDSRQDSLAPLFIRHDDGRGKPGSAGEGWRLSPQSIWGVVKKRAAESGVEATTHNFRHLKARTLLNNGAQLAEVQDILGHASPETTKKIYAPYTKSHLEEAFNRFSLSAEEIASRLNDGSPTSKPSAKDNKRGKRD